MVNCAGVVVGAAVLVVVFALAVVLNAATIACICGGSVSGDDSGDGDSVVTIVNCCRPRGCASGVVMSPRNLEDDAEDDANPRGAATALFTSAHPSRRTERSVVVVYCLMMMLIDEIECCG